MIWCITLSMAIPPWTLLLRPDIRAVDHTLSTVDSVFTWKKEQKVLSGNMAMQLYRSLNFTPQSVKAINCCLLPCRLPRVLQKSHECNLLFYKRSFYEEREKLQCRAIKVRTQTDILIQIINLECAPSTSTVWEQQTTFPEDCPTLKGLQTSVWAIHL